MTAFHPTDTNASNLHACDHHAMTTPLRILAIPGSLRARSTNLLLLETAAIIAGNLRLEFEIFNALESIPPFNPDNTAEPSAVASMRSSIAHADAVIFSTPEYAHGVPGALKNALDWLVVGIALTD
jgi:chromate reductase, NAD(P)H dehydrogenase (quinone)